MTTLRLVPLRESKRIPTAAEIVPAIASADHPDHELAGHYENWRRALQEARDVDSDDVRDTLVGPASDALVVLAEHPAQTMCGVALKLSAAWIDEGWLIEPRLDARDQALKGARLDAVRLSRGVQP